MRTRRLAIAALGAGLAVALALTGAGAAFAQAALAPNKPDSTELINRMNVEGNVAAGLFWNGKTITFRGEAIGERMVRGDYAWIHLNDDAYAQRNVEERAPLKGYNTGMPVWVPAAMAREIDTFGDYQHEGSMVEVTGVFNSACREHGGDADIHATTLRVLRAGHRVVDPIPVWKGLLAALLAFVAALLFGLERIYRNRWQVRLSR